MMYYAIHESRVSNGGNGEIWYILNQLNRHLITEGQKMADYEMILVETPAEGVGLIRLNRPKALNALNGQITDEIFTQMEWWDEDPAIGCIVLTGSDRAFAAGADIKQMAETPNATEMMTGGDFTDWTRMQNIGKPIIAAVSGYALGGGCELAMMADMIVTSESAVFGQPEINLAIIPGAGGTQRLTKAVGKAVAMEMVLADRKISAEEAKAHGLVNHIYPMETYLDEAIKLGQKVASMSQVAIHMAKDAVNKSYELNLQEGLNYEKRNFYLLFNTEDRVEGMNAFIEKRKPEWKNR
jgi:enoyl-CoA hydratase